MLDSPNRLKRFLAIVGPGLLVAATGVGAGDLATAAFAGSALGVAVLWAVVVGGVLKYVVTEGLTRWQLATGQTLLEGAAKHFGRSVGWLFMPYLALWSFFVGSALMSACGVTLHAMIPVFDQAASGKIAFGILASITGLVLAMVGGYPLFQKVMTVCIGLMFVTVIVTAVILWPGTGAVLGGLLIPTIPSAGGSGVGWTAALIGGVGGTVTILCYGYWIREEGREGVKDLGACRLDLGTAYAMTVLFGLAMVVIGSTVEIEGKGAGLIVTLADRLEGSLGPTGRWVFLAGAFGAVFSSLLGVWQAVPYLFADLWRLFVKGGGANESGQVDVRSRPYRYYMVGIALVPMLGLLVSFKQIQKLYALIGVAFFPLLAVALLILNGRRAWVGDSTNRWASNVALVLILLFFGWLGVRKWQ